MNNTLDSSIITPKRTKAEIARENGSKSHGPTTPEGKARAAQNSYKHGLTASIVVIPDVESQELFNEAQQRLVATWQPVNEVEHDLVEEMAVCKWQERRIWQMETDTFDIQIQAQEQEYREMFQDDGGNGRKAVAFGKLAETNRLDLLLRYRGTLNRQYHRAMNQLIKLRDKRVLENTPADPEPYCPDIDPPAEQEQRNEPTANPKPNTTNGESPESINPEPTTPAHQHPAHNPITPRTPPDDAVN